MTGWGSYEIIYTSLSYNQTDINVKPLFTALACRDGDGNGACRGANVSKSDGSGDGVFSSTSFRFDVVDAWPDAPCPPCCSRVRSRTSSGVDRDTLPTTTPSSNLFTGRFCGHEVFRAGMMFKDILCVRINLKDVCEMKERWRLGFHFP